MKFSILSLLGLTLCVGLLIATIQKRIQVGIREGQVFGSKPFTTNVSGHPVDSVAEIEQKIAVCTGILLNFGISADSTRFREDTSAPNADPAIYFSDKKIQQLCLAISANKLDEVKTLLQNGVDVNAQGDGGITPLFWSYSQEKPEAFRLLLESGADPNLRQRDEIPLHGTRSMIGDSMLFTSMRRSDYLLDAIPYSNDVNQRSLNGDTLLIAYIRRDVWTSYIRAPNFELLKVLIESGVHLDAKNDLGQTACMEAIRNPELCLWLIDKGANPLLRNHKGKDLLELLVPILEHEEKQGTTSSSKYLKLRDVLLKMQSELQSGQGNHSNATGARE